MNRSLQLLDYISQVGDTYLQKVLDQQNKNMQFLTVTVISTIFSIDSYCWLVSIRCIIILQMNTEDSLCGRGAYG